MHLLNDTTYQTEYTPGLIIAQIGDAKQDEFYPRAKLSKWDNEANFSIGLAGSPDSSDVTETNGIISYSQGNATARFYNLTNPGKVPPKSIRRAINGSSISALEATSEYELCKHISRPGEVYLAHYVVPEPSLVTFDLMPASQHLEVDASGKAKDFNYKSKTTYHPDDIPIPSYTSLKLCRFYTPYTPFVNPYFMDKGLHNIDMQWYGTELRGAAKLLMDATEKILNKHNIPTKRHFIRSKLYFKHGDRWVKFFSAQPDDSGLYAYININCAYNKAFDFYRPDVEKDVRDQYAYGLQVAYPDVTHKLVNEVIQEFARSLKLPLVDKPFTDDEKTRWQTTQKLQDNYDWVTNAKRSDANWYRSEPKDGLEFEVVLAKKPNTNEVSLTANNPKNVTAYYQAELSFEQMQKDNTKRPPDVHKSLAIYHTSKRNNVYETGKIAHIYRPIAHDSDGYSVFCNFKELEGLSDGEPYDLAQGLTVVVPQEFIDSAMYPITIDPLFGYITGGGSGLTLDDTIVGTLHTSTEAGEMQSLSMYLDTSSSTTCNYEGALYTAATGVLVAQTDNGATVSGVPPWKTVNFAAEGFNNGTDYYISAWGQGTGGYESITLYYDSTSGKTSKQFNKGYAVNAWPNTIDWGSTDSNRQYSIYITYGTTLVIDLHDGTSQIPGPMIV